VRNEKGIIRQPIRFQGQYHDEETGLYYNRWRFYDPLQGRYITQDPIGLRGGVNSFAYPTNPVQWVDPLGLQTDPAWGLPDTDWAGTRGNPPQPPQPKPPQPELRSDGRPQGAGCGDAKRDKYIPDSYMGTVSFEKACDIHDDCYGTLGADKQACDTQFGENLRLACDKDFLRPKTGDYEWDKTISAERTNCRLQANWYQFSVEQWAGEAFDTAQKAAAERAAREQKK
jgi:RHS repeat-associated protein